MLLKQPISSFLSTGSLIIKIPKIELEYPILETTSKETLNLSITKFWGNQINEIGNVSLAGHNNLNGTMFGKTKKLEVGDIIELTDIKNDLENLIELLLSVRTGFTHGFPENIKELRINETNNLFLNTKDKNHFIIISYEDEHYSYNYKKKAFVKVTNLDLIDNLNNGRIGLYSDEFIPNLGLN